MFAEFTSAQLRLGLAMVALASSSHASSVFDTQPVGQVTPASWLETLVLDGSPRAGVLGVPSDRDYFRISVTEPTIAAIYTSGSVNTKGRLYDSDGREVVMNNSSGDGDNFRIETILPHSGTYFLRVEGGDNSDADAKTGRYTLHADRLAPPTRLSLGDSPQEGAIETNDDADFFRLQVTEPIVVAIYTSGDLDTVGTLLDPDGLEIARSDDGEGLNFRIETLLGRPGTYYLKLDGFGTGSYTLHADRLAAPTRLSLSGSPQEGTISTDGEVDYFQLEVREPTTAAIYTTGGFDGEGTLLGPDGREIVSDDDGGDGTNFRIEALLPRSGTYHLRVEQAWFFFSRADPDTYTLHAERLESPLPLMLGGSPREGAISTSAEKDFFRLAVEGPTLASIYTSGNFDARGTLFDPDGREIASDDDSGEGSNFRIDTILPRRGTYYLRLEGTGFFSRTGSYTLHAERLGSPLPILLGGPPQEGAILTGGEVDFFRLAVAEPTAVAIHTSGGLDTGGELYDPNGGLIAWDDDGGEGLNFRIDTILFRRGPYLLKILSSHPASTGSYTLHAAGIGGGRVTGVSGGLTGPPAVYWTTRATAEHGPKIQRANLDGTQIEDLVTTHLSLPVSLVLDPGGGKMYWTQALTGKIQRANLDGSEVEDLITTGLEDPHSVALDLGAGKMYWTDRGVLSASGIGAKIQRANLDGTQVENLVIRKNVRFGPGLDRPTGLALDLHAGKMYWIDDGLSRMIKWANLDGTQVENLITDLVSPQNLALDLGAGKMYWTDGGTTRHRSKIQRANLDGSGVEVLVTGLEPALAVGAYGLALDLDAGKMYWTAPRTSKIQRANLDGTQVEGLVTVLDGAPVALALDLGN
ncbi:MAG: T9SS type A sorting domain-containing protein [Bryobacterales bacterium]|nr:T9SS type A sorting domain-containing protein [Bryobacterales bacterium]